MRKPIPRSLLSVVLLLASVTAAGADPQRLVQVTQIPFSDWLSAQDTSLVAFQGRLSSTPFAPLGDISVADYAGKRAAFYGLSFGFTATGSVTLTEFADGSGQVLVNENFSNALNWAFDPTFDLIFGYSAGELAATPTNSPGLASGHMQVMYTVPDASTAELNLAKVVFGGAGTVTGLNLTSVGMGPLRLTFGLPAGTPGQCNVNQVGTLDLTGGANADGFPVEQVRVMAVGRILPKGAASGAISPASATGVDPKSGLPVGGSWGAIKALYR